MSNRVLWEFMEESETESESDAPGASGLASPRLTEAKRHESSVANYALLVESVHELHVNLAVSLKEAGLRT